MTLSYELHKPAIKRYAIANKDFVRETTKKWKQEHPDTHKVYCKKYYEFQKEAKRFRNILLI